MNRKKTILLIIGALGVSIVLLSIIGFTERRMNTIIVENKLTDTGQITNAPPVVEFTTKALGCFRGVLADILWLRTIGLQDEGNYFEMVQLADWITKLQPRFSGATAYLAWNMAYNISVTCSSFEDRWRWVRSGMELLRNTIRYNPSDPVLYKELGWIYQHKIGNIMDDAQQYYKNQLAIAMTKAFGCAEPDWQALAAAPENVRQFKAEYLPSSPLWKLMEASGFKSLNDLQERFQEEGKLPEKLEKSLGDKRLAEKLSDFLRAQWLRNEYSLDPRVVLEINRRYGKLDWRLPEAYSIYWATLGLKRCPGNADLSLERMISQALKDAFMGGRLLMVDKEGFERIITVPNLNVADAVKNTYQEAYEKNKKISSFRSAKENFMKDAVVLMYNFGSFSKSKKYLEELRKEFPGNKNYKKPLDQFVIKEWIEDVRDADMKQAMDILGGLIYRSCYFLAYGDRPAAEGQEKLARIVYKYYRKEYGDSWRRLGLTSFSNFKAIITKSCIKNFPPVLSKLLKAQLEQERANIGPLRSNAVKKDRK